jgi:hypothetical protein
MYISRALWENRLSEEGFQMRTAASDQIGYVNIVVDSTAQEKFIQCDKNVMIYYRNYYLKSLVVFNKKSVVIDKSGYYDPYGLTWSGVMASQRMADLLPYEYVVTP